VSHDYDEPKPSSLEAEESLDELITRKPEQPTGVAEDEDDIAFELELAGTDEVSDELSIRPVPKQENEFTCSRCFLVKHKSQLANARKKECRDCAA
jgi:hypothetical protein